MARRDRASAGQETVGEPAKGEQLKGPSVDRECTRLSDAFGAPLQNRNLHLGQCELAGEPKPDWATANDTDVESLSMASTPIRRPWHAEQSAAEWPR